MKKDITGKCVYKHSKSVFRSCKAGLPKYKGYADVVAKRKAELQVMWESRELLYIPDIHQAQFFKKSFTYEILKFPIIPYFFKVRSEITPTSSIIFTTHDATNTSQSGFYKQSHITKETIPDIEIEKCFAVDCIGKFYIGKAISRKDGGFWVMKFLHPTFK